jgi:uncharacterized protein with HEPN domain
VSRTDRQLLAEALDHLEVLRRHQARADLDDETVADAVSLRLAAAIEAVAGITRERREPAFGDDWALIWATRNRIAHGYAFIDRAMIAATVNNDLPDFEAAIRRLLEGLV